MLCKGKTEDPQISYIWVSAEVNQGKYIYNFNTVLY